MWMLDDGNFDVLNAARQIQQAAGAPASSGILNAAPAAPAPAAASSSNDVASLLALGEASRRKAAIESLVAAASAQPLSSPSSNALGSVVDPTALLSARAAVLAAAPTTTSQQALQLLQQQQQQPSLPSSLSLLQESLSVAEFLQRKQASEATRLPTPSATHLATPPSLSSYPTSALDLSTSSRILPSLPPSATEVISTRLKNEEQGVDPLYRSKQSFPEKIYFMLEQVQRQGKQDAVSFVNGGTAFLIHKPRVFEADVMPLFFSSRRMSSFQRQLNIYGFARINEGPWRGAYQHRYFQQGKKELLSKIKRPEASKPKSSKTKT